MSQRVVILGATSAIAEAVARLYAAEGAHLVLAGRRLERLEAIAADLRLRGAARVETVAVDFARADVRIALDDMAARLGGADLIFITWGFMAEQADAARDLSLAAAMIDVNFRAPALWLLAAADLLEAPGQGTLVALGSPAGDRGRRYNFIYGAAKAGLATLMEGIAHRFAAKSPRLKAVLIKPGPTDTPMTATHRKGGPLWSTPQAIAPLIRRAAARGAPVAYTPGRWRLIMTIIRVLPRFVFNRLNF